MGKPRCEGLVVYPFLEPSVAHLKKKKTNKQELVEPGAQLWSRVLALSLRGVEVGGDTQCLSYKRGTSWESIVPSSPSQVFCSE